MRRFLIAWAVTALPFLCLSLTSRAADQPLPAYMPADTWLALYVPDMPTSRKHWDASMMHDMLADEQVEAFLMPMLDDLIAEDSDDANAALDEVMAMITGDCIVALWDFHSLASDMAADVKADFAPADGEEPAPPALEAPTDYIFAARVDANGPTLLESLIEKNATLEDEVWELDADAAVTITQEELAGAKLHVYTVSSGEEKVYDFAFGVHDGVLVYAQPAQVARDIYGRLANGPAEDNLASDGNFAAAREGLGAHDAAVYVDLRPMADAFDGFIRNLMAGEQAQQQAQAMGLTANGIAKALDLAAWRSFAMGVDLSQHDPRAVLDLRWEGAVGIARVFQRAKGPATRPAWIPLEHDLHSVTVSVLDVNGYYLDFLTVMTQASPMAANFARLSLINMGVEAGISIEQDVIQVLGPEFINVTRGRPMPEGEIDATELQAALSATSVYMLQVKDGADLAATLDTFVATTNQTKAAAGGVQTPSRTVGETTVYSWQFPLTVPGQPGSAMDICVHGGYLIFSNGEPSLLEDVMGWLDTPAEATIWDDEAFMAALATLPPEPDSVSYMATGDQLSSILEYLPFLAQGMNSDAASFLDLEQIPPPEVIQAYMAFAVATNHVTDTNIRIEARLISQPQD